MPLLAALLGEREASLRRKLEYELAQASPTPALTVQERVALVGALGDNPPDGLRPLRDTLLNASKQERNWLEAAEQGSDDPSRRYRRSSCGDRRAGRRLHRSGNTELADHFGVAIDDDHESVTIPEPETVLRLLYDEPIAGLTELRRILNEARPDQTL